MRKKAKTVCFGSYKKGLLLVSRNSIFLAKHTKKNAAKRTLLLTRYCLVLKKIVNFFCTMMLWFSMVCYEILFSFITLIGSRYFE